MENLLLFKKDFDNVREITLPRNYRSVAHILEPAQRLIRHNAVNKDVVLAEIDKLITYDKHSPLREKIRLFYRLKEENFFSKEGHVCVIKMQ